MSPTLNHTSETDDPGLAQAKGKLMRHLLLIILFLTLSRLVWGETLTVATGEFVPYCSSSAPHKGFANHILSEAFRTQGYELEFDFLPWKRAMLQAESGDYDMTSWWIYNEERDKKFLFSEAILVRTVNFFHLKDKSFNWQHIDDLSRYRLGVTRGYAYSEAFSDYLKLNPENIHEASSDELNFKMLLRNRIDVFPIDVVTGLEILRTKFAPDVIHRIQYDLHPLDEGEGFVLFPKVREGSAALRDIFNRGLKTIRANGTYDEIYDGLLTGAYSN